MAALTIEFEKDDAPGLYLLTFGWVIDQVARI